MYYAVAGYAKHGELARVYGVNTGVGHFFYGPLSLVFFGWMPLLSYSAVKIIWVILNTIAYGIFWWGLYHLYPFLREKKTTWLWFLVWIVSIKPIHSTFQSHNVQLILASIFVLCELYSKSKNPICRFFSGWGTTLSGEVKVFPFFFSLYTFITRSVLVRLGIVVAAFLGFLVPFAFFGFKEGSDMYLSFYQNLHGFHDYAPLTKDAVTLSLASLIATWFSPLIGMDLSLLVTKIVTVILLATFFIFVWKKRKNKNGRYQTHVWALGMAVMALVNSTTRPDYFIFFVPAFASLSEFWQKSKVSNWFVAGTLTALSLIAFICEWTLGSRDLNHKLELLRLPVVGMIILCITLLFALHRQDSKKLFR